MGGAEGRRVAGQQRLKVCYSQGSSLCPTQGHEEGP